MRIVKQTAGILKAHAERGDACDPQSGGRARLSGQPESALATTRVWPMKCERVKRCLVGGVQKESQVCLNFWVFVHVRGVSLGSKRRVKERVMRLSHILLNFRIDYS